MSCKYCSRKPELFHDGSFDEWENEETIASGSWTSMSVGVDADGRMRLVAVGDGRAEYYPKYCPECGRKLEYE